MWKAFFNFLWAISYMIPGHKNRTWFRENKCFGYKDKLNAIREKFPELNWDKMRLAKGGGSLAFIVDNTVFKVRKFHKTDNSSVKFKHEKRVTDAVAPVLPVAVPKIELVNAGGYLFYKTQFIPGRVLIDLPLKRIIENREKIAKTIAQVIYIMFNTEFPELADIKKMQKIKHDIGLTHGDMCSNIIVNPETMDVVGIIDWEYACYSTLQHEFFGIFRVRRKMRLTDIGPLAMWEYYQMYNKDKK